MSARLAHRGPDDAQDWVDPSVAIALGFRRLAVLDTSVAGRQPMASSTGRYIIGFNGEIYNHGALRSALAQEGIHWRGHSDTETLLACFERWGVETTLHRVVGMFAFALWDRDSNELVLARDRLGEKPCYYGWQGETFLFGSDLTALRAHPGFSASIDHEALALYLRFGYVPTPYSIFQGFHKLPPGSWLRVDSGSSSAGGVKPTPYWTLAQAARAGASRPFDGTDQEAIEELDRLLHEAVSMQSLADVPVGAFLSGGIDSSLVVGVMSRQAVRPVKTFTIGFEDTTFDEAGHASAVARHLGTDHVQLRVTPDDAIAAVERLPRLFSEPFADSSAIPTFLVAQLARQHVTVSLSGDGGDELFGGYNRQLVAQKLWNYANRLPGPLRISTGALLRKIPLESLGDGLRLLRVLRGSDRLTARIRSLQAALVSPTVEEMYRNHVSIWRNPTGVVRWPDGHRPGQCAWPFEPLVSGDPLARTLFADTLTYLPDDILVKVDRTTMGVSLESRIPLLDHRIVEFAWSLPQHLKVRDGRGKWLLRKLLGSYVPRELIDRPKQGFRAPIGAWLAGPLADWADDLLDARRLEQEGFFRPEVVQRLWRQHRSGRIDRQHLLWPILAFQAWLRHVP